MPNCIKSLVIASIYTVLLSYGTFTFFMSQMQAAETLDRGTFSTLLSKECKGDGNCIVKKAEIAVLQENGDWDAYMQHPFLMEKPHSIYFVDVMDFYDKKSTVLSAMNYGWSARVIKNDGEAALKPFVRIKNPGVLLIMIAASGLLGWLTSSAIRYALRKQKTSNTNTGYNKYTTPIAAVLVFSLMFFVV